MGFTPPWAGYTSAIALLLIALSFAIIQLLLPSRRYLFLIGIRHSLRSPGEILATAAPIALLVAVIFSSLSVGDGLYESVEDNVERNLSITDIAIDFPGGIPRSAWDNSVEDLGDTVERSGAYIHLSGWAGSEEITIFGIDQNGMDYGGLKNLNGETPDPPSSFSVHINRRLSEDLNRKDGDGIRLEVKRFSSSVDSLLQLRDEGSVVMDLTVDEVVENRNLGRYREDSKDEIPLIAFTNLNYLQSRMDMEGEINKVLLDIPGNNPGDPLDDEISIIREELDSNIGVEESPFRIVESDGFLVKSEDHFFDPGVVPSDGIPTSTYFADSFDHGSSDLAYPVVSAISSRGFENLNFSEPGSGEIVLNNWTASFLNVSVGDIIDVELRRMDRYGKLVGESTNLTVINIVAVEEMFDLSGLVPDIPGVTDAESCSDWDPGFEADLGDLEQEDIRYWNLYKTTPKAVIRYEDGVDLWSPPSGNSTAVWFPEGSIETETLKDGLNESLDTEFLRTGITAVKYRAMQSSRGLDIFPGMFLTFGIVIMVGSLLTLAGVVRSVSLKRSRDWSVLKGLGTRTFGLVRTGTAESVIAMVSGIAGGLVFGIGIGALLNYAISTIWSRTVEGTGVPFSLNVHSLLVSALIGLIASLILITLSVIFEAKKVPGPNVAKGDASVGGDGGRSRNFIIMSGVLGLLIGLGILIWGTDADGLTSAITFVVGGMIASSGLSLIIMILSTVKKGRSDLTLYTLASLRRRPGKTPLTVAVLSMAVCVALSLTAMGEMMEGEVMEEVESYGGGFDFTVETGFPLDGDLDQIEDSLPEGSEVVPILSLGSEGGKCSNINAPFPPRLLGIPPEVRGFGISSGIGGREGDEVWDLLNSTYRGKTPIVVDYNTLTWIYFEDLGSVFTLEAGDGSNVDLIVVGILEPSVLTGTFVMSEDHLEDMFPVRAEYSYFLVGGEDLEEGSVEDSFSEKKGIVRSVSSQALENLDYERSYLYLFREFMLFGLVIAMASSVAFTYARSVQIRPEMDVLRAIGVKRRRAGTYFMSEGAGIYLFSISGALIGSILSVIFYSGAITRGNAGPKVLLTTVVILSVIVVTSLIASIVSAYWATIDYRQRRRR